MDKSTMLQASAFCLFRPTILVELGKSNHPNHWRIGFVVKQGTEIGTKVQKEL
jgi:hypothetical protein